jgi:indole-3-glycerol phosphate synthase
MSKLQEMVGAAKRDLEGRQAEVSIDQLEQMLDGRDDARPFREALTRPGLSVIAEFKRSSPTAGDIALGAVVQEQVSRYQTAGAAAVSILTDHSHFGGELDDLLEAHQSSDLPVLRKDFIFDSYQLFEAAAFGADAVLLIAAVLRGNSLGDLYREARILDLDCIVEVRDLEELERALHLDADIIGINNRDLDTLQIDVNKTFDLMRRIPTGKTIVSESGIEDPSQVARLKDAGVDAILVGHALMHAPDPEAEMARLLGGDEHTSEHVFP